MTESPIAENDAEPIRLSQSKDSDHFEYRPLCSLAIVGMLFGLFSSVVVIMLSPISWLLPAAGVTFSIVALRQIANSSPAMTGRKFAISGLICSVIFLVVGPARQIVRTAWAERQSRAVAESWLDRVAKNQRRAAHQLTVGVDRRCDEGQTLSFCYRANEYHQKSLTKYMENRTSRFLFRPRQKFKFTYSHTGDSFIHKRKDFVQLFYDVETERDGKAENFELIVAVVREFDHESGRPYWRVTKSVIVQ